MVGCGERRSAVCTVDSTGIAVDILHTPRWPYPVRRTALHWDVKAGTSHSVSDVRTILILNIHDAVMSERGYLTCDAGFVQLRGNVLTLMAESGRADGAAWGPPMNGNYPMKVHTMASTSSMQTDTPGAAGR